MNILVKFNAEGSSPADVQREAEMFSRLAASQHDISISRPEDAPPEPGQKGAEVEIGTMLLALITSGAVTALINVLKVYFDRDKSFTLKFENPDGRKVDISANNMKQEHLQETIASLKSVLDAPA